MASVTVTYDADRLAVAGAAFILFGTVPITNDEVSESYRAIANLGAGWIVEGIEEHPSFAEVDKATNETVGAFHKALEAEDGDEVTEQFSEWSAAVLMVGTQFLGTIGGTIGIQLALKATRKTSLEHAQKVGIAAGSSLNKVAIKLHADPELSSQTGYKFSYSGVDGTCPGCGKDHSEETAQVAELIKDAKSSQEVKDILAAHPDRKPITCTVDNKGNIGVTNATFEELPLEMQNMLKAKSAEAKAKQQNLH